jgi:ribonuclease VapC
MVIDTSALLAILLDEEERRYFNEAIEAAGSRVISVASFVEVSIVIESRFGAEGLQVLDLFLDRAGIELAAVDSEQGKLARRAFSRFGKGRHSAGLNFGDCFSYALAVSRGEPLLYKGGDFSQTDVVREGSAGGGKRSPEVPRGQKD